MKQIICNINLFDFEQKILVADLDTKETKLIATSSNEELGKNIAKSCQLAESYNVHLFGVDDVIKETIVPGLEAYLKTTYGFENLEIEVN